MCVCVCVQEYRKTSCGLFLGAIGTKMLYYTRPVSSYVIERYIGMCFFVYEIYGRQVFPDFFFFSFYLEIQSHTIRVLLHMQ